MVLSLLDKGISAKFQACLKLICHIGYLQGNKNERKIYNNRDHQ